jgi:hypothetical protein
MLKLLDEIKYDLKFMQSHTLQPKWYKILKVFVVLGFLLGYYFWFGMLKTLLFFGTFVLLSFVVHMTYRVKTDKWTKSWLDFKVVEEKNEIKAKSIGRFYYSAVVIDATLSIVISQICG